MKLIKSPRKFNIYREKKNMLNDNQIQNVSNMTEKNTFVLFSQINEREREKLREGTILD